MNERHLEGRVALVTGGAGGIGTAICMHLADLGCRVATTYRNPEKTQTWQRQMRDNGYDFAIFACDVAKYEDCERAAKEIEQHCGPIDILVNNAGITRDATLKKMAREQWHEVIAANLDSVFNMTRQVVDGMTERGWGRIINISSINGQKGQFGQCNYASAKAGMHGFTMALALETARKGVTVNTISPGYIATDMVMAVPEPVRAKILEQIPVGRFGETDEIAHVVTFLVSPHSGFITGANIPINGGQHMM
ncbi:MAG: acetoacetyl-CoA reductase [Chromatiales bacterium]|nr:acetoacetyl-CoA reductase [Chromatiales bacterium]